ncbi:DNA alkylation repair protein [Candidatus Berkelbacteria bacterium]|nr:DNA alkylation repair protein [Candidatus Berkelbacteria bacterium]
MTAQVVQRALQALASPERAISSAWFFKTGPGQYGEGDEFLGVAVPEQRKIARQFRELPLSQIARLLASKIHEHRLTALLILVDQFERAMRDQLLGRTLRVEPRSIVEFYFEHLDRVNNWDLVDSSAPQILGTWLLVARPGDTPGVKGRYTPGVKEGRKILYKLARSKSLWDRRIATISTAAFIKQHDFSDTLKIAEMLVHDPHDLIQKAVGWMLREVGNRDQQVEEEFLDRYAAAMPRTMLRYAIEKFPHDSRTHYMSLSRKVVA